MLSRSELSIPPRFLASLRGLVERNSFQSWTRQNSWSLTMSLWGSWSRSSVVDSSFIQPRPSSSWSMTPTWLQSPCQCQNYTGSNHFWLVSLKYNEFSLFKKRNGSRWLPLSGVCLSRNLWLDLKLKTNETNFCQFCFSQTIFLCHQPCVNFDHFIYCLIAIFLFS